MPKLNSACAIPADINKNRNVKAGTFCFNRESSGNRDFFRVFGLEGVEIKPPIKNPLQVPQAHVPGVEADNRH